MCAEYLHGCGHNYIFRQLLLKMPGNISIAPQELVQQLQLKNREAFSLLYDNYAEALFGVISRMVANKAAAEDLLQDAFVKIWKNINSYNTAKGTLFTWMINITRHVCIDYLRSKQHRHEMKVTGDDYGGAETITVLLDANMDATIMDLEKFTRQLEAKYRQVIEMVYFKGYTHDEVAQMLNIPVGTVKTRSRTGLKLLRNLYN